MWVVRLCVFDNVKMVEFCCAWASVVSARVYVCEVVDRADKEIPV